MAVKYYLNKSVLEAARERIAFIFDEFEDVVVGYSGGKDSTVVFELTLEEARRRNRLPLKVLFIDQEAEWQATIEQVRQVMSRPEVEPFWLQVPIRLFNATSTQEEWLLCWDPAQRDKWMRPQEPNAITENVYGTDRFAELFNAFFRHHFAGRRACLIGGVRTEESPSRMIGLTYRPKYKWVTWGKRLTADLHYTFYPIYDWSWVDVWKAIHEHGWRYNHLYDFQYSRRVAVQDMRVSNVHHETAVKALFVLQEFEPDTYQRLTQRISGVDTAGKMGDDDFFVHKLPYMFGSWIEYRDFLLEKLIAPEHQPKFRKHFTTQDRYYEEVLGDKLYKAQVQSILTNDYHCTKLKNFDNRPANTGIRKRVKARRAEREQAAA